MKKEKNKAEAVHPTKEELDRIKKEKEQKRFTIEDEKKKKFIERQRDYRILVKRRILKQTELDEMRMQINVSDGTKNVEPKMLWYGMPYPMKILKATYNLGLESYAQHLRDEKECFDELKKKWFLTEDEINKLLEGEYVTELKDVEKK